jgi:hypothetical protein
MKRIYCFFSAIAITSVVLAQKELPDFGKVDPADLRLKSCSFEPTANAMKLFDVQEIEFEPLPFGARLVTEKRVRIKIFSEKGYKHASIQIPYYNKKKSTKIKDLEGIIYNQDAEGKVVVQKLMDDDFFKEKIQKNVDMINFTFPNLKPGSVIEFRYKKIEKDILQIDPWTAQDQIPTAYASSILIFPEFSRVHEKIFGADTIERKTEKFKRGGYERERRIYFRENIPSFQREPFMSSYKDNLLRVVFLFIPQSNFAIDIFSAPGILWKLGGNMLMRSALFGGQIKKDIPGTEKIIDSAISILAVKDRIIFIYETVKKRIPERTEQTIYPGDLVEAWNSRIANSAEINLLLLNLLKKSGVQCFPLLVSTRENGKVNMLFPSIGQMNGVDVLAADSTKVYILDASLKFQSSLNPPFNILNRNTYLLNEEDMRWVWVDDDRPLLKEVVQIYSILKENGTIEGVAYSTHHDYAKSNLLDTTIEELQDENYLDKKPQGLKIQSVTRENTDDDSKPLLQKTEFIYEPQQTGDFYFINPQFFSSKRENPFVKESRNTDIDFGCKQELTLKLNLSIPATFQVDFNPKSIIVRSPDTSFIFKRTVFSDADGISLQQTFEIKKPVFYKEEYTGVLEFFNKVYALMNEEIILKKKKQDYLLCIFITGTIISSKLTPPC